MNTISNREATLLGLLSEKPKHAYEIEMDIKNRDMRYWTEISMSSVYKLLRKLEEKKLLDSEVKLSQNNVAHRIYSLTEFGKEQFKEKLKTLVSKCQPAKYPIDVGLANLTVLDKDEAIAHLRKYTESIDDMIRCYEELEKFLVNEKCSLANVQLATRRLYILKGEKCWITKFLEELSKSE
jgi:DNA-binding PadR family transcriptional regulator